MIFDLSQYTDEQLREELRIRAQAKHCKTVENEKKKPYIFWQGEVISMFEKSWGAFSERFYFRVKDGNYIGVFRLLGGIGFNQKNMPKVGDKVLLRYKNGFGYTCNKNHSKIIEIIKD